MSENTLRCPECNSSEVGGLDNEDETMAGAMECAECGFGGIYEDFDDETD